MATLIRYGCASEAADHDRGERDDDAAPVGPQVFQQPAHQPRVIGLPDDVVVVPGRHAMTRS
jgi:hypothetical protein